MKPTLQEFNYRMRQHKALRSMFQFNLRPGEAVWEEAVAHEQLLHKVAKANLRAADKRVAELEKRAEQAAKRRKAFQDRVNRAVAILETP